MGILRDQMEADLKIGNYSPNTMERYLYSATKFAAFHNRSPAEMGRDEVREWLLHLIEVDQSSVSSVKIARAAVLFLYRVTLDRELELESLPVPRQGRRIPVVLSGREVQQLLDQVEKPKYRAIFMAMYGGGLRISEACGLRPEHIDSKRMLICFNGKGDKERCTLLSQRLLEHLRDYWRRERPTNGWMFPGRGKQGHISRKTVHDVLVKVVKSAGITKRVTSHTLRHSCATHLQELGTPLNVIQALLGHSQLRTTETYLHTSREQLARTRSPLDVLGTPSAKILG
jgi:site-specific recombinase XerD